MGVLFSAGNFLKESSKYFNVKDEKLTYSEIEKVHRFKTYMILKMDFFLVKPCCLVGNGTPMYDYL